MLENNTEVSNVAKKTTCSLCDIKVGNGFINQAGKVCISTNVCSATVQVLVYTNLGAVMTTYSLTYQVTPINLQISFTDFKI